MTELNQLFDQPILLPSGETQHLNAMADDITSLPDGERSPNIRIWGNNATDYICIDGLQIKHMDFIGLTNVHTLYLKQSELERFPSITHLTGLNYLQIDYNRLTYVPDLSPMSGLVSVSMVSGDIERIERLDNLYQLQDFNVNNNFLTELPPLVGLYGLMSLHIKGNQMEAPAIDTILLQIYDMSLPDGTFLDYSGNPGASDAQRSPEALAAKTSLISSGWTINV